MFATLLDIRFNRAIRFAQENKRPTLNEEGLLDAKFVESYFNDRIFVSELLQNPTFRSVPLGTVNSFIESIAERKSLLPKKG